jgi:hypothetical protein
LIDESIKRIQASVTSAIPHAGRIRKVIIGKKKGKEKTKRSAAAAGTGKPRYPSSSRPASLIRLNRAKRKAAATP